MQRMPVKLVTALNAVLEGLREVAEKAEDYRDNRSENWQESEKGQNYEAWVEALQEGVQALETLVGEHTEPEDTD